MAGEAVVRIRGKDDRPGEPGTDGIEPQRGWGSRSPIGVGAPGGSAHTSAGAATTGARHTRVPRPSLGERSAIALNPPMGGAGQSRRHDRSRGQRNRPADQVVARREIKRCFLGVGSRANCPMRPRTERNFSNEGTPVPPSGTPRCVSFGAPFQVSVVPGVSVSIETHGSHCRWLGSCTRGRSGRDARTTRGSTPSLRDSSLRNGKGAWFREHRHFGE